MHNVEGVDVSVLVAPPKDRNLIVASWQIGDLHFQVLVLWDSLKTAGPGQREAALDLVGRVIAETKETPGAGSSTGEAH
jgi:hypothetical protein